MSDGFVDSLFDLRTFGREIATNWRRVALWSVLGLCIGLLWVILAPRVYRARAAFIPVGTNRQGPASDLLRTLPLGLGSILGTSGGPLASPDLFAEMISSTRLLSDVLSSPATPRSQKRLLHEFIKEGSDSARSMARAVRIVRRHLRATPDHVSGIVDVTFDSPSPEIAARFLATLLDCANRLNTDLSQSQAASVRRFLETRLVEARGELEGVERALAEFRQRNVRYANAPILALEESRLERRLRFSESVYTTILQQFELARIDEARDTPAIVVVEPPVEPMFPLGPQGGGKIALASMGGLAVGFLSLLPRAVTIRSG